MKMNANYLYTVLYDVSEKEESYSSIIKHT